MNKVYLSDNVCDVELTRASEIIGANLDSAKTAFVGRHPFDDVDKPHLYLVTYNRVIRADEPRLTYDENVLFYIDRWVDINITIATKRHIVTGKYKQN